MPFLNRLIKHFKYYIDSKIFERIPWHLKGKEVLVRCVLHPFQYSESKNKIKSNLFLPPPESNEISLLRHNFTNDNFCKSYAKNIKIKDNIYCGLATLLCKHSEITNNNFKDIKIHSKIEATPYDEKNERYFGNHISMKMNGKPMHADLLYNEIVPRGQPATRHRLYAHKISQYLNFYKDNNPGNENWTEEKIKWDEDNCVESVIKS
jgi:hypothetical protein